MKIPLCKPIFNEAMGKAALSVLNSEYFVLRESVERFEKKFASYCGTKHAVAVSSGTHALHLSLEALGLKNKDKVVTTPLSFIASANAIVHAGGEPVFCDIDNTWNIDPKKIPDKIDGSVKAIIPVHLYGRPCKMNDIMEIAKEHGIFVIEDACQAMELCTKIEKLGALVM